MNASEIIFLIGGILLASFLIWARIYANKMSKQKWKPKKEV